MAQLRPSRCRSVLLALAVLMQAEQTLGWTGSPTLLARRWTAADRMHSQQRQRTSGLVLLAEVDNLEPAALPDDFSLAGPTATKFVILGGGSFGIAMASLLARNNYCVTILVRKDEVARELNTNHRHPYYLADCDLPQSIFATADIKLALADATYVVHAVPVQYTREFLRKVRKHIPAGTPVLSLSKGIETRSLSFVNELLEDMLGTDRSYAFLSGPSFAREIVEGKATAVVVASKDQALATDIASLLSSDTFRVLRSKDVVGVEVGGAVKNVIALAAGMSEGLGLGTNAMAALVTRGCVEMKRVALTLGAGPETLTGLTGVGDTFGTCFGPLSRNRNLGIRLGKGERLKDILKSSTEVVEGVPTAMALAKLIKRYDKSFRVDLKFPIIFGVSRILEGKITPREGLEAIMRMPLRDEFYSITPEPRRGKDGRRRRSPSHEDDAAKTTELDVTR